MIEVCGLTKRYGEVLAVDDLTFGVRAGEVTGFLGPNGAGKSTTLRMILGLDAAGSGTATVQGRPYSAHPAPLTAVGALLDPGAVLPSRTAFHHLLALAAGNGIPRRRMDRVLAEVRPVLDAFGGVVQPFRRSSAPALQAERAELSSGRNPHHVRGAISWRMFAGHTPQVSGITALVRAAIE